MLVLTLDSKKIVDDKLNSDVTRNLKFRRRVSLLNIFDCASIVVLVIHWSWIVKNLWRKANRVSSGISPFVFLFLSPLSFKLGMLSICLTFAPPHSSFYGSCLFEFQTDLSAETTHRLGVRSCRPFFLKILPQTIRKDNIAHCLRDTLMFIR